MAVTILSEKANWDLKSAVNAAIKAIKTDDGDYFERVKNNLGAAKYNIDQKTAKKISKIMDEYEDPKKDNTEGIKKLKAMIAKTEASAVSAKDMFNAIPEQGLKDLLKSGGVELDGNESEDELRGMLKMVPKTEAFKKRIERVSKIYESYGKAPIVVEHMFDGGNFNIQAVIRNINEIDANELCDSIEALIKNRFPHSQVYAVQYNQLPNSMFENKQLTEIAVRAKKPYNSKTYMKPDKPGSFVKVIEDEGIIYYSYNNEKEAENAFNEIAERPDHDVIFISFGVIDENGKEIEKDSKELKSEEKYVYHHDTMDSDLVPDIDEKCTKDKSKEDDKEVLTEEPPKECKKEHKSKFIKTR